MKYNLEQTQKEFRKSNKQKFLFFWGHQKHKDGTVGKSCLSQWWESDFTIDGNLYYSAEHYMMAEKARLFNDFEIREQILNTKSPAKAKKLGRKVANFDQEIWKKHRYEIVKTGNYAKFNQNPELKDFLISTKSRIIVEASPVDAIWGIGLAEDNAACQNPLQWKGLNLLGFALMEVRDMLLES